MEASSATDLTADAELTGELRSALWAAQYDAAGLRRLLAAEGDSLIVGPSEVPIIDRALPADDHLATLIRLFMLGVTVDRTAADAALGTLDCERCLAAGLLEPAGDGVRGALRLVATHGLIVACGREHEASLTLGADHVMGITPSTEFLAELTIREPVRDTLDLCCGGGLQAMLCARHSRRVVATDLNPRALAFTELSARLNGIDNIELREGDLLEPVGSDDFDLIVANPPFIISPDDAYAFRDSELEGDEVSQLVVRGTAERLREGAIGIVLVGWAHAPDGDWSAPLRAWVDGLGCDAWLLHHNSADPADYAIGFNRPLAPVDPERYAEAVDRWIEYDRRLGIEQIGYGAVILRRRKAERNWVRADHLHDRGGGECGALVRRLIAAQDMLDGLGEDERLLDLVLETNRAHRLEQVLRLGDDGYTIEGAGAVLEEGLGFRAAIDAWGAQVLLRLDGRATLRDVLAAIRAELDPEGDAAELEASALRPVRRMIELGFIRPAGASH